VIYLPFNSGLESAEELYHRRVTRILANDFPTYFAIVSHVTRDSDVIGVSGGVVNSTVDRSVEAVVPPGAFKKNVKLCLQVRQLKYVHFSWHRISKCLNTLYN